MVTLIVTGLRVGIGIGAILAGTSALFRSGGLSCELSEELLGAVEGQILVLIELLLSVEVVSTMMVSILWVVLVAGVNVVWIIVVPAPTCLHHVVIVRPVGVWVWSVDDVVVPGFQGVSVVMIVLLMYGVLDVASMEGWLNITVVGVVGSGTVVDRVVLVCWVIVTGLLKLVEILVMVVHLVLISV